MTGDPIPAAVDRLIALHDPAVPDPTPADERARRRVARQAAHDRSMRDHGTHACYVHGPQPGSTPGGCRCAPCRAAHSTYERDRARRVAPAYVAAARARAHITDLHHHGVGLKRIAEVSGISHGALWKLVYGLPNSGRPPSKRIRHQTEQAILAVTPADAAPGAHIPAARTWDHVATLLDRGWTKVAIARAIGQHGTGLQLGATTVTAANAHAVRGLLDQPVPPRRTRHGTVEPEPHDDDHDDTEDEAGNADAWRETAPSLTLEAGDWQHRGACRPSILPADQAFVFFPGSGDRASIDAAKRICAGCPVAADCLQHALRVGEHGVWGGTTEAERRRLRQGHAA